MKKKKVTVVLSLGAAALLLIGGISVYAHQTSDSGESETVYKETTAEYGTLTVGITESGSVTIGSISQDMDEDISTSSNSGSSQTSGTQTTGTSTNNSSVVLEVEEVYVSVGQQVKAGDALLKLTDESIEKYRKKLKEAVTEASADYNSAALSSAKEKVSANYSYNLSVAEGSVAQEEYEATISELQDAVDEAQEAVDESQALLTYYQEMIDSGMDLSESLADEQENYDKLYNKLKAAKSAYTTKSVEAEKKYKEAMLSYENADSQYSADVTGVDVSVDTAQDTLTDAKEALSEFEIFVGDGTIYSDYDGTIMSVGYEAGDDLSTSTSIVTFADTDAVTMTVSVSEEDISEIAIGDEVMIELNAYEDQTFSGEVESIDTSVSSGSSTVSYNVTVKINGDVDGIYTDMTGNVTFIEKQVADQFKNLNAGAIDISYDGGDKNRGGNQSSDDSSDSGMMMMPSGSGAPSGSSSSGGSGASGGPSGGFTGGGDSSGGGPSGGPGGGNGGDGGGMPGDMGGFFGGGSDMEDRMNQENITLDEDDVDDIETFVSGISAATISYMTRSTVDGGDLDEAQTYSIAGVKDSYAAISNLSLAVGDFITESDDENKEKVCVLGASIAEEIFGSAIDAYGSVIYIDDRSYVVNGVLSSMGTVASGISPDDSVFIPYATGVKYLVGTNVSPTITVIAEDVSNVSGVTEEITEVLATSYPNAEFTFEDAGSKMEAASASNEILTMLLMAMAAIVFVVGGIGIMNVLFVSVKERTNEIGILKAIGCSQRNILFEFLAEAAAISLIGGVLGIVSSLLVTPVAQYLGVRVELTPAAFLIALLFALITGTLFGFYPAYKASKLVPVEALGAE